MLVNSCSKSSVAIYMELLKSRDDRPGASYSWVVRWGVVFYKSMYMQQLAIKLYNVGMVIAPAYMHVAGSINDRQTTFFIPKLLYTERRKFWKRVLAIICFRTNTDCGSLKSGTTIIVPAVLLAPALDDYSGLLNLLDASLPSMQDCVSCTQQC